MLFRSLDHARNYTGNLNFDGTGFGVDGKSSDGNIVLGGINGDTILAGIGNDFVAGGGGSDTIFTGRNGDFVFVEGSLLDRATTDGDSPSSIDAGETADDVTGTSNNNVDAAGTTNDRDMLLAEFSDDDEAVSINLADGGGGSIGMPAGAGATVRNFEDVDASGNLYGVLNDVEVKLGNRAIDSRSVNAVKGTENYGIGSTSQLIITGSGSSNIIVAGYDNDTITADAGNDIIYGGNLEYLLRNKNNPNLLNATGGLDLNVNGASVSNDGKDNISGDAGNDSVVYEADNGATSGNAGDRKSVV